LQLWFPGCRIIESLRQDSLVKCLIKVCFQATAFFFTLWRILRDFD
jgi:hypothetical protein